MIDSWEEDDVQNPEGDLIGEWVDLSGEEVKDKEWEQGAAKAKEDSATRPPRTQPPSSKPSSDSIASTNPWNALKIEK